MDGPTLFIDVALIFIGIFKRCIIFYFFWGGGGYIFLTSQV